MSQGESKQFRRNYKYTHLDADELRKRREDNSIMLRKQKGLLKAKLLSNNISET